MNENNPVSLTPFQQWHHDSKWAKLNGLITFEAPTEFVRRAICKSKEPVQRFIIRQIELRQALGLKTGD